MSRELPPLSSLFSHFRYLFIHLFIFCSGRKKVSLATRLDPPLMSPPLNPPPNSRYLIGRMFKGCLSCKTKISDAVKEVRIYKKITFIKKIHTSNSYFLPLQLSASYTVFSLGAIFIFDM